MTMACASVGGGHDEVSRQPLAVLAAVAAGGTILNFFYPKIVFTVGALYFA